MLTLQLLQVAAAEMRQQQRGWLLLVVGSRKLGLFLPVLWLQQRSCCKEVWLVLLQVLHSSSSPEVASSSSSHSSSSGRLLS
jgi:hypothetical protein